jgi:hypothetical protein
MTNLATLTASRNKSVGVLLLIPRSTMCLGCLLFDFRLLSTELWTISSDVTDDATMITGG